VEINLNTVTSRFLYKSEARKTIKQFAALLFIGVIGVGQFLQNPVIKSMHACKKEKVTSIHSSLKLT
jgi:hypothetical protein